MIYLKNMRALPAALALFVCVTNASAYKYTGNTGGIATQDNSPAQVRSAACAPATALLDLEWNNVRATIETGGNMWQNRANGVSAYEVPKNGGVSAIYAGGLWMGGKSQDQTLKLAAVTFRANGNDFWTGPLTTDGTAEVTSETCQQYDKFTVTLRDDAIKHRTYWDLVSAGASSEAIAQIFPDGYIMPSYFTSYPAHGNTGIGQDFYLAPFKDYNSNGIYDPENGDYPWYDFLREIDCKQRRREDVVPLFGDQTYYWIFNDKGNIHTESQGLPIGMEVRAQAFAFSTNDEVNNMTFLNYVLINQGSQTLTETFFGSWVDSDMGFANDDYVGCDVKRGLGYCYNGDGFDEAGTGSLGYGQSPPAVGVDFFEGPYQNEDQLDNPNTEDILLAEDLLGIPYPGLGIGYGDSIVDNERFGMRRFVYYNNSNNPINGEPNTPQHFYNYMKGIWKNGAEMLYGGNGVSGAGVISGLPAQYMFPGDSDPLNWSTYGVLPPAGSSWTEQTAGNAPADRRFIQAAGPFTLEPGDYNNITLGVVWARSFGGDEFESVELLRIADDKAQSLFDNCFELVNGPDAPDVAVSELDRELILMLTNNNPSSNNYQEEYLEFDPAIPEELLDGTQLTKEERSYRFEGYLVYQLLNDEVSNADLGDITRARLIAQCDIRNEVGNIINYSRDQATGLIVPELMVQGANDGLQTSFRITEDAFALGSPALINHKTYYFMVLAYGYNNYQPYDATLGTGQDESYKPSRKGAVGAIKRIAAIPHSVAPRNGGMILNSTYGTGLALTRLEGSGNGMNEIFISSSSEASILAAPHKVDRLEYLPGGSPVEVKVVDPLRVPAADFRLSLADSSGDFENEQMYWKLENLTTGESDSSYRAFSSMSEDILLEYGLSISWGQYQYLNEDGLSFKYFTDLLSANIEFQNPQFAWFGGIPDADGFTEQNWIRSGTTESATDAPAEEILYDDYQDGLGESPFTDPSEIYEKVFFGTWSPYSLVAYSPNDLSANSVAPTKEGIDGDLSTLSTFNANSISGLNNVDIVFTADKSKWTRSVVLEMQPDPDLIQTEFAAATGNAGKMKPRRHRSIDKSGKTELDAGFNTTEGKSVSEWGMGWFPGYAIDIGTGERLNIAYGEDSWLAGSNGADMLWNPTPEIYSASGTPIFGGQHWIYVFKNLQGELNDDNAGPDELFSPRYDSCSTIFNALKTNLTDFNMSKVFMGCTWVGSSLSFYLPSDYSNGAVPPDNSVRLRLRVAKPYRKYSPDDVQINDPNGSQNGWRNLFEFSTKGVAALSNDNATLESALDNINVVPNPYYAFSAYETNKLDNRVKITNLPYVCTVTIYDLNGTLIRQFKKGDPTTSIDWDLKNQKNVPIASGAYIIHVDVPEVGEKVIKWFGVMRPIDLDSF